MFNIKKTIFIQKSLICEEERYHFLLNTSIKLTYIIMH